MLTTVHVMNRSYALILGAQQTWSAIMALRVRQVVLNPASATSLTAPILTNSHSDAHLGKVTDTL